MTATTRLIWRVLVPDIERRDAWGDRIVDALRDSRIASCSPIYRQTWRPH
jgi:hypothetical protein